MASIQSMFVLLPSCPPLALALPPPVSALVLRGCPCLGFSQLYGVYGAGGLSDLIGVSSFSQHWSQFARRSASGEWAHPVRSEDLVSGCGVRLCFVAVRPNNAQSALRVCLASGLVLLVLVDALDVFGELFFLEPNLKERIIGEVKNYRVPSLVITVARLLRQVVSADWLRPILAAQLVVSVLVLASSISSCASIMLASSRSVNTGKSTKTKPYSNGFKHIIFEGDVFTVINLLNSQETNLNIKTLSHTISLWNNCSEEIEFMHQKELEMDVQMCYLSELYKTLTIMDGSLSFEILCAWRSLMYAKEVISPI
ncbi:hypothetical protein YC2023_033627 [Brassica napus]